MFEPWPPDLPDEPDPPDTEPRGMLEPPALIPPTAMATGQLPPGVPPDPTPGAYPRRLTATSRMARVFLSALCGSWAWLTANAGHEVAAACVAVPGLLTVYGALRAEGIERTVYRRFRWLRRRMHRYLMRRHFWSHAQTV